MLKNIIVLLALGMMSGKPAKANDSSFWDASCTSASIKQSFGFLDKSPFKFHDNCSSSTEEKYFEIINGKDFEYHFLEKLNPKCVSFRTPNSAPGTTQNVVCINDEVGIYEMSYEGNKEPLLQKLQSIYGPIKRTLADNWAKNAKVTYSLFANTDKSYVILQETAYDQLSGITYGYKVGYIKVAAYQRWLKKYKDILGADNDKAAAEKAKNTEDGLAKIK